MKNQAKENVKKEFGRIEKASGSRDLQHYEENPETSVEPKGKKRGGAKGSQKPRHVKQIERDMRQGIERGSREIEEQTQIVQTQLHCKQNNSKQLLNDLTREQDHM